LQQGLTLTRPTPNVACLAVFYHLRAMSRAEGTPPTDLKVVYANKTPT